MKNNNMYYKSGKWDRDNIKKRQTSFVARGDLYLPSKTLKLLVFIFIDFLLLV
jgi:hypothetical protein